MEQVLHQPKYPFSRSYGANWSSSLRGVLPSALEYSSHPPVSVLVRSLLFSLEVFLGSVESDNPLHPKDSRRITPWSIAAWICLGYLLHAYPAYSDRRVSYPPASPHRSNEYMVVQESLCLFTIAYAFRPRLRIRLTPRRLA